MTTFRTDPIARAVAAANDANLPPLREEARPG
jgi:hypothetical protein